MRLVYLFELCSPSSSSLAYPAHFSSLGIDQLKVFFGFFSLYFPPQSTNEMVLSLSVSFISRQSDPGEVSASASLSVVGSRLSLLQA